MLCLVLPIFRASFEVTSEASCCMWSYGVWLNYSQCPILLHSLVTQPQSDRDVAWTWTGFKFFFLIYILLWNYSTPNEPHLLGGPQTSKYKLWALDLCKALYVYIFFRGTCCLNAYTTIPGTRHVELIMGIWWYPNESVISANTYNSCHFHQRRSTVSAWTWSLSSLASLVLPLTSTNMSMRRIRYIICHSAFTWTVVNRWHFPHLKYVSVAGLFHTSPHTHIFEVFISYSLCILRLPSSLKIIAQSRCLWIYHITCSPCGLKIKIFFWVHFSLSNVTVQHIIVLSLSPCQWCQGLTRAGCWVIKDISQSV